MSRSIERAFRPFAIRRATQAPHSAEGIIIAKEMELYHTGKEKLNGRLIMIASTAIVPALRNSADFAIFAVTKPPMPVNNSPMNIEIQRERAFSASGSLSCKLAERACEAEINQ